MFGFNEIPLSKEEEEFPLAYAALVYKWTDEVFYMLSAFYHPQNVYCIAIDRKSDLSFMTSVLLLGKCFPNIQIMVCFYFSFLNQTSHALYHISLDEDTQN
uniref:MULE transposase domain-containing protein n=1 Tax=Ascaris lumbricoides TaxID=6252 RepID=A0A9J2PX05_ASCLU